MRIAVDIDATLPSGARAGAARPEPQPPPRVCEWLERMRREGHTIVIHASRRPGARGGDAGEDPAGPGGEVLAWLARCGVPCDELCLGEPRADIRLGGAAVSLDPERAPEDQLQSVLPVYVIAAAGEGRRFREAGYREEKFEIRARGRSLAYWALRSLPLDLAQRIVVLGQASQREALERTVRAGLAELGLCEAFVAARLRFAWLERVTRGQAETALAAREALGELWQNAPAVIYNVDTYFASSRLRQRLLDLAPSGLAGLMGLFPAEGEHLSFGRVEGERVVEAAEKRRISPLASTGLYAFRSMARFEEVVRRHEQDVLASSRELYVAPFYNYVIAEHGPVGYDVAETVYPIGTPAELEAFAAADLDDD